MKKTFLVLTMASLGILSCKDATNKTMETEGEMVTDTISNNETVVTETPMDSVAMQKAWEAYMAPSESHQMMKEETGKWNVEMSFWMAPNAPVEMASATATIEMLFGDRYQISNYNGTVMGEPFEGRATLAYDNASKEFVSTWIDNMGTGMMVTRGTYDTASKSITFSGKVIDPFTGKEKNVRELYTFVDENTRKLEMFEASQDGTEFKNMQIMMKRT